MTKRTGAHYAEDLVSARRLIEGGSYSQALPRLINITSRDQTSPQAIEAYYWTARAYHGIGSLTEARSAYERYLELAPEGPMAEECRRSVESIKTESCHSCACLYVPCSYSASSVSKNRLCRFD